MPFGGDKGITVTVNGQKINFHGVIDRVDTFNNYFRIIDYKTGNSDFSNFGEVASGVRLQLIMYLKAFMDGGKMQPAGAFYMPITTDYVDTKSSGQSIYKLKGIILNNLETILAMDSNLSKPDTSSDVINLKTDSNGAISTRLGANMCISDADIRALCDYVYAKLNVAVQDILDGNIKPMPYKLAQKEACKYCNYRAMCQFSTWHGNKYNESQKITSVTDLINDEH